MNPIPARTQFLFARCVYVRELVREGESHEQIARALSCDPGQVALLAMTNPAEIVAPFIKGPAYD